MLVNENPLPIVIDRSSPMPFYYQLAEQLAGFINDGTLKPGETVESELSLADRLQLSRPTVRRAIVEVTSRGLLVRRRGVGTTVAKKAIHRRNELSSLYDDLKRSGQTPSTELLEIDYARTDRRVAEILELPATQPFLFVKRLRSSDEGPLAVMRNWLPQRPGLDQVDADALAATGLYALLRQYGIAPVIAHQTVGARPALPEERKLLDLDRSEPVLTVSRKAFDASGTPVEYGEHRYRADRYALDFTLYTN